MDALPPPPGNCVKITRRMDRTDVMEDADHGPRTRSLYPSSELACTVPRTILVALRLTVSWAMCPEAVTAIPATLSDIKWACLSVIPSSAPTTPLPSDPGSAWSSLWGRLVVDQVPAVRVFNGHR